MQIGAGALVLLALVASWQGTPVVRRTPLDFVLGVCAVTFALSTLASGRPFDAPGWTRLWIVITYFGVFWWLADARAAVRFVGWLVVAASIVALYGIVQHYTGADWYRELLGRRRFVHPRIEGAHGYAAVGFFRNYLTYAHVLLLPLGFALAAPTGWTRFVAVPLLGLALVFSTARGAWLAAVAMTLVLVAVSRGAAARLVVLSGVAVLAALLSPGLRQQIVPALTSSQMNVGRVGIYAANLDIVAEHPILGLGFGRYQKAARPYYARHPAADRRSHAHNNFLQIAAEAGLVGLAAFTLVFATILRFGIETVRAARDPVLRATALGACLGLTGFLVGGLTQYSFGDTEVASAMWATTAVLMRLRESR
jgi:O-antigen ligase